MLFAEVGADPASSDDVVAYCRMGHRGSLVWSITTQILGWDHVRLYDGSWTEWGSLVGAPVEGPDVAAGARGVAGSTPATLGLLDTYHTGAVLLSYDTLIGFFGFALSQAADRT